MKNIDLPQAPKYVKGNEFEATFEIKGCYPGYGNTLGNALRRVLLSSLPGYAVTQIKINGIDHEFSTIPGVKENLVQIILNVKALRFKMHKEEPTKVKIKANGAKLVTAANIEASSSVEVINTEAPIATLTDAKAKFEMELTVEKGIGYSPTEERDDEESKELGAIAIDTLFTPIKHVNYAVENMRVGKRTDFDKVTFEITTDGSIKPEEAFKDAANILISQFAVLAEAKEEKVIEETKKILAEREATRKEEAEQKKAENLEKLAENEEISAKAGKKKKEVQDEVTVEDLNIPTRIIGILKDEGIESLDDLATKSEEELANIEGLGDKGIKEIKKAIGSYGLILES